VLLLNRIGVALVLTPALSVAQAPRATIPLITVDGQIGGTSTPVRSGPTFYVSGALPVARVAVAVRLGSRAAFRPVVVLDYFGTWGRGDAVTVCSLAPNGTCMVRFPDLSGVALGFGIRGALGTLITVGATGGVGRYKLSTGTPPERLTGFHADAELSFRLMRHAGAVLNVRHVEAEKFQGARMWFRPVTVGVRIH
jgi:hypothetical protein